MEKPKNAGSHDIVGGKTILGKIFQYQEKTGMSYNDILKLPYIVFVLCMADAPQVDYDSKKDKKKVPETQQDEVNSVLAALG